MLKRILYNPQAVAGFMIILLLIVIALAAPWIAPNAPSRVDPARKYQAPTAAYPLGTDHLGRCELSRLIYGARYSLGISLPILLALSIIGLTVGSISAANGGRLDRVITMICDVFLSFPALIAALAVISALGNGVGSVMLAIVIAAWAQFVRVVRSSALAEMAKPYLLAARIAGCNSITIVFRHLIPNLLPQFMVYASTGVASSILMVSAFSFLGLGLPIGTPEWGAMLNEARGSLLRHPEMLLYPGLCIVLAAVGFNLFGEALRDIVMPEDSGL